MANSNLDNNQVLPLVLDETNEALQVSVVSSIPSAGAATEVTLVEVRDDLDILAGTVIAGKIQVDAVFSTSDIEIGAVELKNATDDTRAVIKTDGVNNALVVTQNSQPLPSGAATETTLNSIKTQQTDKSQFTKITDGTDTALVTASGELNVLATAQPGIDIGDVTINNAAGGAAVNIQDGGNSITVDGSVTVSAINLDIRDLVFATDKVDVSGSTVIATATNLDIRDLVFATDKVDVSGSSITATVSATDLDIRNLVFATDKVDVSGSSVSSFSSGYTLSEFARNDYSSTNVTTSAYVQLIASTTNTYEELQISDTSGETLKLATGAVGFEVDKIIIPPGGTFPIKFRISSGTRISIKAISATANSGDITLQLLG